MNNNFWMMLDEAIETGQPVDPIIPHDCGGMSETEFLQILSVLATYGEDEKRAKACRKKLIEYESRRNGIL